MTFVVKLGMMNWLGGSKLNEARKWVHQLTDINKRERAAAELLRLGAEAAPALIEVLQTQEQNLLSLYQQVLVQMGIVATPHLTHSLLTDHPIIRSRVAEILAKTKDPQAVPALLQALHGEFYTVRARAALALGEIGDKLAIEPLLEALTDKESEVRIGAVLALGRFRLPRTFDSMADPLLEDAEITVREAAAKALGDTRQPQALTYLMIALRDPFWWYERESASDELLGAIEGFGTLAVGPLLDALKDNEGTVRRYAALLLGRIGDQRAVEPLGMALYDMHYEVGHVAAEALAKFGPPGLKLLADALHHPEAWLRQHAITGLTLSGDQRITPALLHMLKDPEREVVKLAIQSLGELKDPRALPALQVIAADRSDREMYTVARQALENFS